MMEGKTLGIALVQMHVGMNKSINLQSARNSILKASSNLTQKHKIVVLPECFQSPYGIEYFKEYAETLDESTCQMLSQTAQEAQVYLIGGSMPEKGNDSKLFNTCCVYDPHGERLAIHRKLHLFDIHVPGKISFQESLVLSPGNSTTYFTTPIGNIGLGICYDIRFPDLAMLMARKYNVIAMIYPGAFNMTTGPLHWQLLQQSRALDNQIYVAACSPARDLTASYVAYGHSSIVDPMGRVLAITDEKESIVYGEIDPNVVIETRKSIPCYQQRRFDIYSNVTPISE